MTKFHSGVLYGLAAIMMIYHHLFGVPEMLNCKYNSLLSVILWGVPLEQIIAWFSKICVAIYAFISGYGLCKSANKQEYKNFFLRLQNDYRYILNRIFVFFPKVCLTFILFATIGLLKGKISFNSLMDFLLCFFGIDNKINGTWWYVSTYYGLLLQFPFINAFFSRYEKNNFKFKSFAAIGWLLTLVILFSYISKISTIIFLEGYLVAKYSVFDKINQCCRKKVILGVIVLLISIAIRCIFSKYASYNRIDLVIIVFFIYGVCQVIDKYPLKFIILSKLGNYSVYIWLSHAFYCLYYFQDFVTASHFSTIIFIKTFILSITTAIILSKVEKILKKFFDKSFKYISKILKKCYNV